MPGSRETLRFLPYRGCRWDTETPAGEGNRVEVKWTETERLAVVPRILAASARSGSFEKGLISSLRTTYLTRALIRWLREIGGEPCSGSVICGHLATYSTNGPAAGRSQPIDIKADS